MENLVQQGSKKIKVLYVEDNPLDIDLTINHFSLSAPQFLFTIVNTGKEFLKVIKEKKFDLLLIDNHLPDMMGMDLLKSLSSVQINSPIIMITGLGDEDDVIQALRLGATDYIPKHGNYLELLPNTLMKVYNDYHNKAEVKSKLAYERINVLYVEPSQLDTELTLEFMKREAPYIDIKAVGNAAEAWEILNKQNDVNLILCDLRLPGKNGIEFLHELKHNNVNIPFVMITGAGGEASALAALKLGAYDFIPKTRNYLDKLPDILQNAFIRYKLDILNAKSTDDEFDLTKSMDTRVQERTIELLKEIEERKNAENELKKKIEELERFNELTIGRELKMIELKKEVNSLLKRLGEKEKYEINE